MQRAANPFRATFFSFWVVRKLATVNSAPSKSYQTGVARAATCGCLRKALTSAEIGTGMALPGFQGRPAFYRAGKGGVKRIRRRALPAIMALHRDLARMTALRTSG